MLEELDEALILEEEGNVVEGGDVVDGNDLLVRDVAEHGDLGDDGQRQRGWAAACDLLDRYCQSDVAESAAKPTHEVGHQTKSAQVADAGLSGLGLELAVDRGNERHVEERKVVLADAELELPHRLDERRRLDVTDRAAELVAGEFLVNVVSPASSNMFPLTSMMQTSGAWSDSSTGICATRSTQSWMASVTCGITWTVLPR